jgi:ribosomal protein L23
VEHFYNVEVTKVTTSQHRTAPRRQTKRRVENIGTLEKRAYVTLKEGQQLHLLEAVEE